MCLRVTTYSAKAALYESSSVRLYFCMRNAVRKPTVRTHTIGLQVAHVAGLAWLYGCLESVYAEVKALHGTWCVLTCA